MCFLENKPKLTLMLPVARSGRVYLSYKPLFQASLKSALSAKFTTLRVTDIIRNKRTILKNSQKLIDFNVYLPSVSSGVFRHSLADSAPSGKTNKIFYGNADTYPST